MGKAADPGPALSKHRLEALSDGIFAVVMTLLVLEIKPEHLPVHANDAEMWEALRALARPIAAYALTFGLTGAFWIMHHRKFMFLDHTTVRHTMLTLLFLFAVSLLPLSISIWIPHSGTSAGIVAYYFNFALIALTLLISWLDAQWSGLLTGPTPELRRATVRFVGIAVGATCGAVTSWFHPPSAGIVVILAVVITRLIGKRIARA